MQRFVYSPKAYAYIITEKKGIVNVSDYLVRGNVNRVVNQVSTAEITLRNPNKMWTDWHGTAGGGGALFRPMDPITIYLKRLPNRPVQVFTGYLDTTPYYQLYPGTVTLKASCTLKRLLYTYFDMGLPNTQEFLRQYGWTLSKTGQLFNVNTEGPGRAFDLANPNGTTPNPATDPNAQPDDNSTDPNAPNNSDPAGDKTVLNATDGSIGNLLFATLKHIGYWHPKNIYIEKLPKDLYERLAALIYDPAKQELDENIGPAAQAFMQQILGSSGHGSALNSGGVGIGEWVKVGFTVDNYTGGEMRCGTGNIPMAYAELGVTNPSDPSAANKTGGYLGDLFNLGDSNNYGLPCRTKLAVRKVGDTSDGIIIEKIDTGHGQETAHHKIDLELPAARKLGYDINSSGEVEIRLATSSGDPQSEADRVEGAAGSNDINTNTTTDTTVSTRNSPGTTTIGNATKIYKAIDANVSAPSGGGVFGDPCHGSDCHKHMGCDIEVSTGTGCHAPVDGKISFVTTSWDNGGMIHFTPNQDVGAFKAGQAIGWGHVQPESVSKWKTGDSVVAGQLLGKSNHPAPHVHFIYRPGGSSGGSDGTHDGWPILKALQEGSAPTDSGDNSSTDTGTPGGDALAAAKASAFATVFNFPTAADTLLSQALTGDKSLMNDTPLLPVIQEFTKGSMRSFQSLPNGAFFAFFPDYFGAFNHRKPYWNIEDIEILDGEIKLTDDSLATHVYVVGDTTFGPLGGGDGNGLPENFVNKLFTQGVVTLSNAGAANFLNRDRFASKPITDKKKSPSIRGNRPDSKSEKEQDAADLNYPLLRDQESVIKFLQKYGARPFLDENAMIRSGYFEMFAAYQTFMLMWARQFMTTFTFTFMPEIYPGGLVAFPNHGIQMYVDEVRHSFDYESGFTTQANLSAPSALSDGPQNINQGMIKSDAFFVTGSDADENG